MCFHLVHSMPALGNVIKNSHIIISCKTIQYFESKREVNRLLGDTSSSITLFIRVKNSSANEIEIFVSKFLVHGQ